MALSGTTVTIPFRSTEAHRLVETWRLLAAARGSSLDIVHHREPSRELGTDKPQRIERGWIVSYGDGVGARIEGVRPVTVDLHVPRGRAVDLEIRGRQGPLTALVMDALGFTPLHAAAIQTPAGLLAIAAPSGLGKSTLASLAHLEGWPVGGDDLLALEEDLSVLPLPGTLRTDAPWVKSDSVTPDGRFSIPLPPLMAGQSLRALVTLVRGKTSLLETIRGVERLAVLADATLAEFLPGREEKRLKFAAEIPVHRMTIPDDLAVLRANWKTIRSMLISVCR